MLFNIYYLIYQILYSSLDSRHHGLMVRRCFPAGSTAQEYGKDCGFESHWCRTRRYFAFCRFCCVLGRGGWCGAVLELHPRQLGVAGRALVNTTLFFIYIDTVLLSDKPPWLSSMAGSMSAIHSLKAGPR